MTWSKLDEFKRQPELLARYAEGVSILYNTVVIEALREIGRTRTVAPENPNYVDAQAAQANWSIGYNDCLDDLLNFVDRYIQPQKQNMPNMDYQAIDRALERGDITQEEADELRKSTVITYSSSGQSI